MRHHASVTFDATSDVRPFVEHGDGEWSIVIEAEQFPAINLYLHGTPRELEQFAGRLLDVAAVLAMQAASE